MRFSVWYEFSENLAAFPNSLDIPRSEMPQIKSVHHDKFLDFLKKRGVMFVKTDIYPNEILPTQKGYDVNKVRNYIADPCKTGLFNKRIIVSKDFRVVDGHHHAVAFKIGFPNRPMPVYQIDLPINALLRLSDDFKHTSYEK